MSRTWLITSTSSGFGRQLTEILLQRGDRVAPTVRKQDTLDDLKKAHGDRLWVEGLDVVHADDVRRVAEKAFSDLKRIDVVVSNAGYARATLRHGCGRE